MAEDKKKRSEEDLDKVPGLDTKTARRILRFLNEARTPLDLATYPDRAVRFHAEYRQRNHPDLHAGHEEHEEHKPFIDEKLAKYLLEERDRRSLLYGFLHIRDLFDIRNFREILEWIVKRFSRAVRGDWSGPYAIPGEFDRPVHAALLRSGKVLLFGLPNGDNTYLWTPNGAAAGAFAAPSNQPGDSLFCAGHAFLSDGRLLVVGGGGDGTGARHNHGWLFDPDPAVETWQRTTGDGSPGGGDMGWYRWYPTLVTMGDEPGRVLVVSGDDTSGSDVQQMEMYLETSDEFVPVWGSSGVGDTTANHSFPQIYPGMNLLPGGEVFYSPTGWHSGGASGAADYPAARPSGFFAFSSTSPPVRASWTNIAAVDVAAENVLDRVKGMSVLFLRPVYPFVQVLVVGGGKDPESTTTYQMINLSMLTPKWGPPLPLPDGLSRVNVNVVALPDGTVFMCGGRPASGSPADGGACWVFNPADHSWREMDRVSNPRQYHSVALLLPDGRVLAAGNENPPDRTIEIFTPPYLFDSAGSPVVRPAVSAAPALVHHGHRFDIETPNVAAIHKVVFVRPMAVTHQTDSEQRVIQLPFGPVGATTLRATAPNGWHPHALAPRGWYLLFIIDKAGVPSDGKFIHLH